MLCLCNQLILDIIPLATDRTDTFLFASLWVLLLVILIKTLMYKNKCVCILLQTASHKYTDNICQIKEKETSIGGVLLSAPLIRR